MSSDSIHNETHVLILADHITLFRCILSPGDAKKNKLGDRSFHGAALELQMPATLRNINSKTAFNSIVKAPVSLMSSVQQ